MNFKDQNQFLRLVNEEQYAWNQAVQMMKRNTVSVPPTMRLEAQEALIVTPMSGLESPQNMQEESHHPSQEEKDFIQSFIVDSIMDSHKTS